jgi:phospholipase/lecithinase/hemolysin
MRSPLLLGLAVLTSVTIPTTARAGTIDAIYSFGDSLSDTGNDFLATSGTLPGAPYFSGRFSNGPIWIDRLAGSLGLSSTPSLAGGTNFAFGGAETGLSPVHPTLSPIDLLGPTGQIAQFTAAHPTADPNALYTIWIGSNDLADVLTSNPTPANVQADIGAIVANIDTSILDLAALGAQHFLVVTVPDLGKAPAATQAGPVAVAASSAVSAAFDNTLVFGGGPLPSLALLAGSHGLNLSILDAYSLLDNIVANGALFGFTDTTDPCLTGEVNFAGGTPCSPSTAIQNQFVFWDTKHPTSAAQSILGSAALAVVTPEPVSWMTLGAGLAMCGFLRLRKLSTARPN